jgi:uncharacterized protein (DUF2141 family)
MLFVRVLGSHLIIGLAAAAGSVALPQAAMAALVGRDAPVCAAGQPSVQVHVVGFKQPTGILGVALYSSNGYLKPHAKLRKIEVPVRSAGPMDVCIAVPGPGRYAVAVHHDLNGNDKKDRSDGGGFSRNPRLSIFNLKPGFEYTGFNVGGGPTRVSVQLLYANGLSIGPVRG